ncbi:dipeptide epimerase [Brachyspira alvinipulli]|uniref:mandelate racemase/muconate lactonizing enzyme family protein n=1 Tax=Brachyspira alvinipulli TaxID=84379 RepID=UPI00300517B4
MKITSIKTKKVELELKEPFVTAALSRTSQPTILVKVETDEGIIGYGESVPTRHIVGESPDSIEIIIKEIENKIKGENPLDIESIHRTMDKFIVGNNGAKAGIDIALYDIKGKLMNQPLYKVLGGFSNQIESDVTLSINKKEEMVESAIRYVKAGFKILKVKIGLEPKKDIETIKMIREAVGNDIIIKADANQGYTVAEAVNVFNELLKYDVHGIEQPVPYWDINNMAEVRKKTSMEIVADESVKDHHDAMKFIRAGACDKVNIKLTKSSGIFKAEKINAVCEAAGIHCMVGCMVESRVAITAGAHFAASKANILDADLDGYVLTKELPFVSGGFTAENGLITLLDKPGLGLDIEF